MTNNGWVCPRCNGVMSPTHPVCFYCKPEKVSSMEKTIEVTGGGSFTCEHVWSNNLLLSDPPQKQCVKCGATVVEKSMIQTSQLCEHGMPVKFNNCIQCRMQKVTL